MENLGGIFLALGIAGLLVQMFWPKKKNWPIDDYMGQLSYTEWREEAKIYEKILRLHPMLTPNEHNQILLHLHSKELVEREIQNPNDVHEIESPKRFDQTYIDHIEPFSTVASVRYKLAKPPGGKRRRPKGQLTTSVA